MRLRKHANGVRGLLPVLRDTALWLASAREAAAAGATRFVAGDRAGSSVSSAGDANQDGYDDVLVGAPAASSGAGIAYLLHGPISGATLLSTASAILTGETAGDAAGTGVTSAGDVDQDGFDDFLISAPRRDDGLQDVGAAYLVQGPVTGAYALSNAPAWFQGDAASQQLGGSMASSRDANGDGQLDILLGAPGDIQAASSGGAAYLFLTEGL